MSDCKVQCQIAMSNVASNQCRVATLRRRAHSKRDGHAAQGVGGTNNLNLPKIIANLVEGESSGLDFGTLPS